MSYQPRVSILQGGTSYLHAVQGGTSYLHAVQGGTAYLHAVQVPVAGHLCLTLFEVCVCGGGV